MPYIVSISIARINWNKMNPRFKNLTNNLIFKQVLGSTKSNPDLLQGISPKLYISQRVIFIRAKNVSVIIINLTQAERSI